MRIRRQVLMWAQSCGVLGAAYFIWTYSVAPRLGRVQLAQLMVDTLIYAAIAWASATFITFWMLVIISLDDTGPMLRAAIRSSAVAMWFAPAIILMSALTPATFTASLILIVNTT